MINYLLTSTFIHAAILLGLCYTPGCIKSEATEVNTSGATKTEVTLIQKGESAPILPTYRIYAKSLGSGFSGKKIEKVDMTDYANRVKATVDPVWVAKIEPLQSHFLKRYEIIVLLSVDKYGRIYSMRIKKSSGDPNLDALAVQTFREISRVPNPPESVVKDGIEWNLSF